MADRTDLQRWVRTWAEAGPELDAIRRREVREANNLESLALLAPAFNHAVRTLPLRESSGLVQMQDYFQKLRG